jgi:uncharacterized membrane protein
MKLKPIGKWAFLAGLVIVVLASFLTAYGTVVALILFLLGLVVGFLNISEKDSNKFLVANITLLTGGIASMSALSMLGVLSTYLVRILANFVAFVSAAALVVAIKAIFETSKK